MNLQEALLTRRTVYRFEAREVAQPLLDQAFEAARWAPCHKHTHPWRFYQLGPNAREKLLPLATDLAKEKAAGLPEPQVEKGGLAFMFAVLSTANIKQLSSALSATLR